MVWSKCKERRPATRRCLCLHQAPTQLLAAPFPAHDGGCKWLASMASRRIVYRIQVRRGAVVDAHARGAVTFDERADRRDDGPSLSGVSALKLL
jgi:hypothetical protein